MLLFLLLFWKIFLEPLTSGSILSKKNAYWMLLLDAILEAKNKEEMSSDFSD